MESNRYLVMGAGQVGFHLAKSLADAGHIVSLIEMDPVRREKVAEELDAQVIQGNGAHAPVLERAGVVDCDLFMAVSSSDEANLVASHVAKNLGARRTVVRVQVAAEAISYRKLYQELFRADLLLSTQLLTTTRVLDLIRGHSTMGVEYLAAGKVQLRKVYLDEDSPLTRKPLKDVELPKDSLVVAFFKGDELIIPGGDDRADPGDEALILGRTEVIAEAEKIVSRSREVMGTVVIGGGGQTAVAVAEALRPFDVLVKIIERDRGRAKELSRMFPHYRVLHGDVTDVALLRSESIPLAEIFVALTGNDESNLMGCLLAQDEGVDQVLALVHRSETQTLWQHLGLEQVFSPRALAYERITDYIHSGFSANIVSLQRGKAQVMERRLFDASPAAGVTLAEIMPPRGLIVAAVARGKKVFVPSGADRLEAGDLVILFVHRDELDTVQLLFPGREH